MGRKRKISFNDDSSRDSFASSSSNGSEEMSEESKSAKEMISKMKSGEKEERKAKAIESITKLLNISEEYSNMWKSKFVEIKHKKKPLVEVNSNNSKSNNDEVTLISKINHFDGELRPYQIEGVTWMHTLFLGGINGILADEMGLGKTVQIIAFFAHLIQSKIAGPHLVVAPLSTISNWRKEFERFAPLFKVVVFHGSATERNELKKEILLYKKLGDQKLRPVFLTTYQTVLSERNFLEQVSWKYLVIDEAQRIKNHQSKLSMILRKFKCFNILLLTGTPLQNNMTELWALLNFVMPQIFNNMEAFSSLIMLEDLEENNIKNQIKENNTLISKIHKTLGPFMLRRIKKDVLPDFVPKKETLVYCPLTDTQHDLYKYTIKYALSGPVEDICELPRAKRKCTERISFAESDDAPKYKTVSYSAKKEKKIYEFEDMERYYAKIRMCSVFHVTLKKIANHPFLVDNHLEFGRVQRFNEHLITESGKMQVLDAVLHKLKKGNHKVLIFSTMTSMLDLIEDYMYIREYQYCRLDGSSKMQTREESIDRFNNDPNVFVFLISTRAGGLGLNLTSADTVIFYDRDWNPQVDIQAQDRCHRIGQNKPVMIYTLITKNTIDEQILNSGTMKRRLEKLVIKDGKFVVSKEEAKEDSLETRFMKFLDEEKKSNIIHPNGFVFSDEELDKILDRSELYKELESLHKSK